LLEEYAATTDVLTIDFSVNIVCPDWPLEFMLDQTASQFQDIIYSYSDGLPHVIDMPVVTYSPVTCFTPTWEFTDADVSPGNSVASTNAAFTFNGTSLTIQTTDSTLPSDPNLYNITFSFAEFNEILFQADLKVAFQS